MSDASLTNIRMVRPKGPKIFLGALVLVGLGAAAWWAVRPPGPVGEREDPGTLLVVGDDPDVAATLGELGFEVQHGTFEALAAEGAQQDGGDGKEGIEAILHLADVRGAGYVALQDPASHGIDGITVTADSADVTAEHGWAVFTVGELGMPPKVTVDGEGSELPLPPYVQVLRAALQQDRLAGTLFTESQLPIDAVELHHQVKAAVELHGAYAMLDRRVAKDVRARIEALEEAQRAPGAEPVVLAAGPLETTEVLALADGTVLSLRRTWTLDSPRDPEVSLQPSSEFEVWAHPPGTADPATRERCRSLRGGTLALEGTEHVLSPRGDVLMLESVTGLELWALDVAAGACAFTRKGAVPRPQRFEFTWGEPHGSGRVLRPAQPPEGLAVHVWTAGEEQPQPLMMAGCTRIVDPVWIDEGHFAISCAYEPPEDLGFDEPYADELEEIDPQAAAERAPAPPPPPKQGWIYLVRIADGRVAAIPGTVLGEHTGTLTLHVVPGGEGLELLAVHPWGGKLLRLRSATGVGGLLEGAEATFVTLAESDAEAMEGGGTPGGRTAAASRAAPEAALPTGAEAGAEPGTEPGTEPAAPPLLRPAFVPVGAMVAALRPEAFTVSPLDPGVELEALSLSPDGTRAVYVTDRGHEVQVLRLDDGSVTTVSKNAEVTHRRPRFTADGTAVVFTSELEGNDRIEQVGQRVALAPSR